MRFLSILFAALFVLQSVSAAPLWLERRFIPTPELAAPIFAVSNPDSSLAIDHQLWADFLSVYVAYDAQGLARVDYGAVAPADRERLRQYLAALQAVDVTAYNRDEQLAFWINLYNAATVDLILRHYPTASIRKVEEGGDGPWQIPFLTVGGVALTLSDVENHVVRAVFDDPRIHYGLNCASVGCPNLALEPYRGETLETMLDAAARDYINNPRGVTISGGRLTVSKIFGWYREDFGDDERAVLEHIREYAAPDLRARLERFNDIDRYVYDWDLNDAALAPDAVSN